MSTERLTFPMYLLPSFSFPFRRRQTFPSTSGAAVSVNTSTSIPGLSYSPTSSCNDTPAASPTSDSFLTRTHSSSTGAEGNENENRSNEQTSQAYSPISPQRSERTPSSPHLTRPHPSTLRCLSCSTHISYTSQIVSKGFTGRHGRAYLVAPPPPTPVPVIPPFPPTAHDRSKNLANIRVGRPVNRELLTGHHVVADVNCAVCNMLLGWKYVDAREAGQRYKIGKFILETRRVVSVPCYEDSDTLPHNLSYNHEYDGGKGGRCEGAIGEGGAYSTKSEGMEVETKEEEEARGWVHFDSEDEDECEELFAGTWDAEIAQKRRIRRVDKRKRERERERVASKDSGVGGL
ncbi:hypothetical protein MFRU_037g00760 [Monilinia fructicola]|uniref:Yippee domain-containing protein n=1 Tax=Monilinia fructicola TaxID=38448 RepID=A0A5M9JQA5_MONFR|nr:hypothetical protein EYC84_000815 [Monilinia fructicola]KAG4026765.1 hypothetical protein MFRU_037g00760 [Monilinia fructicola]